MAETRVLSPEQEKIKNNLTNIVEEEELENLLRSGRKLRVKFGIDPTASLIHIGHLVILFKLKEFQELGHDVYLIIGDFTATIGDPSGRTTTRTKMSYEETKKNAQIILEKCMRFLIKEKTKVLFNSDWFSSMELSRFFELLSRATISQVISREDFKERFEKKMPIYTHEFLYPFLQAYDSVVVKADIEIGGNDQLFNLILGRDIMRSYNMPPQVCLTTPILEGLDGKLKMSKTYGNYISVDDEPEAIYGKLMGVSDELIVKYGKLLAGLEESEIEEMKKEHPFKMKEKISFKITEILKGKQMAEKAKEWFDKIIRSREIPEQIPEFRTKEGTILQKLIKEIGLVKSVSEAVRLTESGGIYIDGQPIKERMYELKKGQYNVRIGKIKFVKIIVE
ncbi:MAG: tyrosine--tRNA ligase [Candidatus Calescibacterium sp.]|nr:tyrosine--tRNA ligase [Candidatus Calescibacterium sp.]MCX7733543.1 tyrosine--tRNA ligase [bacterium]MDW8087257.1 tyrosine--tRNA ligase [Candidatus Calescibacterium sp.]